jgi:hypothetical protein
MRSLSSVSVNYVARTNEGLDKILDLLKLTTAILYCVNEADIYHSRHLQHSLEKTFFFWWFKNRYSLPMRHRANCRWFIRIWHCPLFLRSNTFFFLRRHHTDITVCGVISWFPLHHGHCKRHRTSLKFNHAVSFDEQAVQHVWCPLLVLVTYFTTKTQEIRIFLYIYS